MPTLVIGAARDGFTPPERSRAMAAAIPGAELLEIDNASHTAPIEHPHLINDTIRAFLASRIDGDADDSPGSDPQNPGAETRE